MARIQVLPLTTCTLGAASETSFVLIIDQTEDDLTPIGDEVWTPELASRVKLDVGAIAVWCISGSLDVANVDERLHLAAQAAVERVLCPESIDTRA